MRAAQRGYALRCALGLHAHKWRGAARDPNQQLATYRFGSRRAAHHFCKVCGVFPFFWSDWGGRQHYVLNVACLEGVDPYEQQTTLIDGKSF